MTTGAILLAAGFSNRFGSLKLAASLPNGNSVLRQTLLHLSLAVDEIILVTREEISAIVEKETQHSDIQQNAEIHLNRFEHAELGMGATLANGASLIPGHWQHCLVCLSDMPFIQPQSYQAVIDALGNRPIVVPYFENKAGNPVGFDKRFFEPLQALTGDSGGRSLVKHHADQVLKLELNDPGILADVDTPEDLHTYGREVT